MKKYLFDSDSVSYFYDKFSSGYANISAKFVWFKRLTNILTHFIRTGVWICQFVADFLAYIADKENENATQELLDIPGFMESFEKGQQDIEEGRLVDWRKIRDDV